MFLEKHSRFVRHYRFGFASRHKHGPALPLIAIANQPSVRSALEAAIKAGKAHDIKPNGDIVEILQVRQHKKTGALVILLHKASPNAADPMYRKKARTGYTVRAAQKDVDEDQSVSAHLIIMEGIRSDSTYDAILEEIPSLSMSAVQPIIRKALHDYEYEYVDKSGKQQTTHAVFKPAGVKSETMSNALKSGRLGSVTLSRPADATFVDDDAFEPRDERLVLKVTGKIEPETWVSRIGSLAKRARDAGWEDFLVDIELDDERSRRVPIARGEEAKEILFIRSREIQLKTALDVCSIKPSSEFVETAVKAIIG